jgi:hypothetical protein
MVLSGATMNPAASLVVIPKFNHFQRGWEIPDLSYTGLPLYNSRSNNSACRALAGGLRSKASTKNPPGI